MEKKTFWYRVFPNHSSIQWSMYSIKHQAKIVDHPVVDEHRIWTKVPTYLYDITPAFVFILSTIIIFYQTTKQGYYIIIWKIWKKVHGSGSTITERWIRGSGSTFPKCWSQDPDPDPDPRRNEMDPKRWLHYWHLKAEKLTFVCPYRSTCLNKSHRAKQG